jgi:hypothetical protein
MAKETKKFNLSLLIAVAALWGLVEAGLGMYLRGSCAPTVTGSLMTGAALFFAAVGLAYSRRLWAPVIMLLVVTIFKSFDAFLLHLPFKHGAVANPIFAFITEVVALIFIFWILDKELRNKVSGKALMGGLSALVAVNLFPLVKYFSGIPACVYPGTQYPLALYFAPLAIGISMITVPVGFVAGERLAALFEGERAKALKPNLVRLYAYVLTLASFAVITLLRVL